MEKKENRNDWIITGVLVLMSIALILIKSNVPEAYQSKDFKFAITAMQLLTSIAVGFFIQKIQSLEDYKRSQKKYALSAYRRTKDLEKSLIRLIAFTNGLQNEETDIKTQISAISEISFNIKDNLRSASADWEGIIEDELEKKRRLNELEEEEKEKLKIINISKSPEVDDTQRMHDIRLEISKLKKEIPQILEENEDDILPREGRFSDAVFKFFLDEIATKSSLTLHIGDYSQNQSDVFNKYENSKYFIIGPEFGMSKIVPCLFDENNQFIRIIENQFSDMNIYGNDFAVTLLTILSAVTKNTDTLSINAYTLKPFILHNAVLRKVNIGNIVKIYLSIPADINSLA